MNHRTYKEWLQLSFYNELSEREQYELNAHLVECAECRAEREELKKFHLKLSSYHPAEVTGEELLRARRNLRIALRRRRSRQLLPDFLEEKIRQFVPSYYRITLGGIIILVAGIAIGYVYRAGGPAPAVGVLSSASQGSFDQGESHIANIRFIDSDAGDGEVEFTFDAVARMHVKGSVDDLRVQKVLAQAILNGDNPGIRLRTMNAIAAHGESDKSPDPQIKSALVKALKSDENPGVRREALRVLRQYPFDNEIRDALLYALVHDRNSGIRIAAINGFEAARTEGYQLGEEVVKALKQKIDSEKNNYVRIRSQAVLQEITQ